MANRKPLVLIASTPVWSVSRGAKLESESDSSPEISPSKNPNSRAPPPSLRADLGYSPPIRSPLLKSTSLPLRSRPKLQRRNPNFRRFINRPRHKPRGAKLETDSDLSPEKLPPRNLRPPPPPRAHLPCSTGPPSPPAADDT